MEPIEEAKSDKQTAAESTDVEQPAFNDLSRPTKVLEPKQTTPAEASEDESDPVKPKTKEPSQPVWFSLVKSVGGLVIAGVGILFLLIKKFGLFKFLKVGGLMTAAAFAGYEPDEMCMGNERCEEAVVDQIDDCWEFAGLDDYDLEYMPDDEYNALKPKLENDFVACFRYEDTNERVFVSPLDLRYDLIDNCNFSDHAECLSLAESQFKGCYDRHQIAYLVSANTTDFYQEVTDHANVFKAYYGCFKDAQGEAIFTHVLNAWDELY